MVTWLMTTPLSVSAVCWIREPTRVTGAMNPERGMEMYSIGMEALAQSTTFWLADSIHFRGGVGQAERMASGFAFNASAPPRTVSRRSWIVPKPELEKAPVTTGFSQKRRLRKSR